MTDFVEWWPQYCGQYGDMDPTAEIGTYYLLDIADDAYSAGQDSSQKRIDEMERELKEYRVYKSFVKVSSPSLHQRAFEATEY